VGRLTVRREADGLSPQWTVSDLMFLVELHHLRVTDRDDARLIAGFRSRTRRAFIEPTSESNASSIWSFSCSRAVSEMTSYEA
jgi:hypothetical protein